MLLLTFTLALVLAPAADADDATDLTAPFEITLGHFFAVNLHQSLQTFADLDKWDAPISTTYDTKTRRIDVVILGSRESLEGARESMERFRTELLGMALVGANYVCGTEVTADQVSVVYVNRQHWKEIIRYTDGRFIIPE
jgi:hypothetical protein